MTNTNRAANRVFLLLIGTLLLTSGYAAVAVSGTPQFASEWRSRTSAWHSAVAHAREIALTGIGVAHPVPWFLLAMPVAAAALLAALLLFVLSQGRGDLGRIADRRQVASSPALGYLTVDMAVARDAIRRAARGIHGIAQPSVSAFRVKGAPALKVGAAVIDGVDPASVVPAIEAALAEWDALLGERCPVYVQLSAAAGAGRKRLR